MANKNGTLISNLQASPQVKSPVYQLGGTMKIAQGIVECVAGDFTGGDTIMLAPIPTGASVVSSFIMMTLIVVRLLLLMLVCILIQQPLRRLMMMLMQVHQQLLEVQ